MRLKLTALERYVLGQTLIGVAGALAVIGAIVLLIDFVELSRQLGSRDDVDFVDTLRLTIMKAPATVVTLLPFIFLFGTLAAFVGLNRRSELVAMRAAGVSAWRFIMPAAGAAFVIGALTVGVLDPGAAAMTREFETARIKLLEGQGAGRDLWASQGDETSRIFIHAGARAPADGEVKLKDVSMFIFSVARSGTLEFSRRVEADEAELRLGHWALTNAREATPGSGGVRINRLSVTTPSGGRREIETFSAPQTVSVWSLPRVIDRTDEAGFSATGYRLRLHQLLAAPFLLAAMSILAAAFSLRLMRLGGLALLAGSGVGLGFAFFFLNELSGALGQADVLPAFAAAWAPPILALLSGLTLLCYTEDG